MKALTSRGGEARYVGGVVRDALLERPVERHRHRHAVAARRSDERLEAAKLKAIPTGLDHGTVTAVARHAPLRDHHLAPRRQDLSAAMPTSNSPPIGRKTRCAATSP